MIHVIAALIALGLGGPAVPAPAVHTPASTLARVPGTLADVERYVRAALRAPGGQAILVINVAAADDFVQLTTESGAADFSFPLITPGQQAGEASLRKLIKELHLTVHQQTGSNGMRFLDVAAGSEPDAVTEVARTLLVRLHSVTDKTPLDFDCQGCADLPTSRSGR